MNQEKLLKVILSPHISEKSTVAVEDDNQYVFKVASDASKPEIKQAVEMLFNVKVGRVQVLNVKGKTKRFGTREGMRKGWKKAYVTLQEGQELDLFGGAE